MDQKFFEEQFAGLREDLNMRFDGIEKRMDGLEKSTDGIEKSTDGIEKRADGIENRMDGIEKSTDGIEKRMGGIEKTMDGIEKRVESIEKTVNKLGVQLEIIRSDVRLIAEGHVMLNQKFSRFESEYIHHAVEMRHDVLNLYKITYGDIERRVKELESIKQ